VTILEERDRDEKRAAELKEKQKAKAVAKE